MDSRSDLTSLSSPELLARAHRLVEHSCRTEAQLLLYLGEIDDRKLYLERAFPSMFAFCVDEFKFSEAAAYDRITVARAGRQLPAVIDALRSGQVHLTGLRLLVPHLKPENQGGVLAQAAGKTKREIEELVARLAPQPAVPDVVRKLPEQSPRDHADAFPPAPDTSTATPQNREDHRAVIAPLSEASIKIQFTASHALRDKLREAQDLLRHRIPAGDLACVFEKALDVLIEHVKKNRFATNRRPRPPSPDTGAPTTSRHVPDHIKRIVYERDGGRCTFTDERGQRCAQTGGLEFDHVDGFARTHRHEPDRMRLLCRAHNQYEAERIYGRKFMERARTRLVPARVPASLL